MKQNFMTFDPMDPLDLAIMVSEECDEMVDEVDDLEENASRDGHMITEAYETEIGADPLDNEIMMDEYDGSCDNPCDPATEDAEDYDAAEMELLAGNFGSNDCTESIDDIEFTARD